MKKNKIKINLVILFLLLSSSSVFLILASYDSMGNANWLSYAAGIAFWLFLILGYVLFFNVSSMVKKQSTEKQKKKKKRISFTFFKNRYSKIFDGLLILSLICIAGYLAFSVRSEVIGIIIIFTLLFSIHMHFITNGKTFNACLAVESKVRGK